LERYFDRDVTDQEKRFVKGHLQDCQACQDELRSLEELQTLLKAPVDEAARQEDFAWVWQKIEREIQDREKPSWRESIRAWLGLFFPSRRRVLIPAVAVALLIIAITSPLFFEETPSQLDSSVVVYLESDTNNVMVYEPEKENVTVIWLFEGPDKESPT
jgi:anti-sigma factor RsiW